MKKGSVVAIGLGIVLAVAVTAAVAGDEGTFVEVITGSFTNGQAVITPPAANNYLGISAIDVWAAAITNLGPIAISNNANTAAIPLQQGASEITNVLSYVDGACARYAKRMTNGTTSIVINGGHDNPASVFYTIYLKNK